MNNSRQALRSIAQSPFYKYAFILFLIITAGIYASEYYFTVDEYIDQPQHGHYDQIRSILLEEIPKTQLDYYNWYFYLEFLYGPLLMIMFLGLTTFWKKPRWYLLIAPILAVIFDWLENLTYLGWHNSEFLYNNISNIDRFKMIFYGITAFAAIRNLIDNYINPDVKKALSNGLKSSWISIIVIIIIFFLLSFVGQGGTIIVHLMDRWWDLAIVLLLINFLALLISHYPSYFMEWKGNQDIDGWKMGKSGRLLGVGDIYYIPISDKSPAQGRYENMIKRSLGILLYLAWIYGILVIYRKYLAPNFPVKTIIGIISLVAFYSYYMMEKWKSEIKPYFKGDNAYTTCSVEDKKAIAKVRHYTNLYWVIATLFLVFFLFTLRSAYKVGWSCETLNYVLATSVISLALFIHFRIFRSLFKHFYGTKLDTKILNVQQTANMQHLKANPAFKWEKYFHWMGHLSHNLLFIKTLKVIGLGLFLIYIFFLIGVVMDHDYNTFQHINPLIILLYYLILLYSTIAIGMKLWKYYSQDTIKDGDTKYFQKYKRVYHYWMPYVFAVIGGIAIYASNTGNNLHELTVLPAESATINLQQFSKRFQDNLNTAIDSSQEAFTINAYGGGLKSNLWTMLVLDKLQEKSANQFLERTLSMSGVSGGAMGLACYSAICNEHDSPQEIKNRIDEIGRINAISLELNNLLFSDFFREMIPVYNIGNKDRAYYAMRAYADKTGMDVEKDYEKVSFQTYWKRLYDKRKFFPALLINTTSTAPHYGVAPSVSGTTPFPGGTNILDIKGNRTLGFFGAVSTTNRFPFLSPAARIPGKGHFLDGGYFENSGLLCTKSFLKQVVPLLNRDKCDPNFTHVVISNGKGAYIKHFLNELKENLGVESFLEKEKATGETGAILNALVDVEEIPNYFEQDQHKIRFISLPHKISYLDVEAYLRGNPKEPLLITNALKEHNDVLEAHLKNASVHAYNEAKWGVVESPLSRLLSEPGMQYQKAMIESSFVKEEIQEILNSIK